MSPPGLSSMVDLRPTTRIFCGVVLAPGEGPTLYSVACSPQAWAAALPFSCTGAMLWHFH